ncbi:MAG TPA: hypothetical protein VIF62_04830, partial [Labilithrix sp.]
MKGRLCSLLTLAPLLATANVAAQEPVPTLPDENEPPPRLAPREPPSPEPEPALVVVAPAPSPRAPRYGAPGEVAITNGFSLGGYYTTYDGSQARYGSISFDPAIDWFIVRNLFVGFEGTLSYAVSRGYGADSSLVESDYTTVGGGFRLGYAIPLGEHVSLVPRVTLGVESVHATQKLVSGASSSVGK